MKRICVARIYHFAVALRKILDQSICAFVLLFLFLIGKSTLYIVTGARAACAAMEL
jgi:hypothetical protein